MNNTYQSFILQNKLPICQLDIREHVVVDRVGGIKKITGARELFVLLCYCYDNCHSRARRAFRAKLTELVEM